MKTYKDIIEKFGLDGITKKYTEDNKLVIIVQDFFGYNKFYLDQNENNVLRSVYDYS